MTIATKTNAQIIQAYKDASALVLALQAYEQGSANRSTANDALVFDGRFTVDQVDALCKAVETSILVLTEGTLDTGGS